MIQHQPALDGTVDNPMKTKFAVSVIVILILASFCLAEAQQTANTTPRIGFIFSAGASGDSSPWFEAFQQGLRDLGYVEGKNILIERRYGEGKLDRMPALVNDLVQQKVDAILAPNNVSIRAAKEATKTIPDRYDQLHRSCRRWICGELRTPWREYYRACLAPSRYKCEAR